MFDDLLLTNPRNGSEQDFRLAILNALMRTPHREVAPFIPLFRHVHDNDPLFFVRLAAWYFDHGTIHDLKQLFIAFLCVSNFSEEFRQAGAVMLQKLPPYQVERTLRIVKGHRDGKTFIKGIAGSVPRSMKTAIEQYLRTRENDPKLFDSAALHARRSLKTLYAALRIKPGENAQKILFDNEPPLDSKLFAIKLLATAKDPTEQARLIVEHKIPYRVASSTLHAVTPSILVALVSVMTPQEVINNLASLKKRGAMDNADLRAMIEHKLESAKTDKRVSALKTRQAIASAGLDDEMVAKVEAVGDKQIKAKGTIKRPTALLVDKSGSMEQAIELGKQIASIVAPICQSSLYVFAFDSMGYAIKAKGTELSDWEKAFKGIKAAGNTSLGVAVRMMRDAKQVVEQIVVVTDQGENAAPYMAPAITDYAQALGVCPSVLIVNVGNFSDYTEKELRKAGIEVDTFTFKGDYYSLPSLIPLLAGGTRLELLMEIMDYPLPERIEVVLVGACT